MAIASIRTSVISRGKGKSSVAAAAYRSGEKLYYEQEKKGYDYSRKRLIAYTGILAPDNAPDWVYNRQQLWNAVEKKETRCNSRTAREIRIALPKELTLEQNIEAVGDYAKLLVKLGMIVDVALHNDKGNPHAHMMLTTRAITPEGFGEKVRYWDKKEALQEWHKNYEKVINYHLEKAGCPERIDIRSYTKQGRDRIPTIHLGHYSHEKEQRGEHTTRGDRNREIEEKNRQIEQANKDRELVKQALRREQEAAQLEAIHRREVERQTATEREQQQQQEAKKLATIRKAAEREAAQREVERQKAIQEREARRQQVAKQRRKFEEWQVAHQQRYKPEPRQILESELANPQRRQSEYFAQPNYIREEHHGRPQRERQHEHERGLKR